MKEYIRMILSSVMRKYFFSFTEPSTMSSLFRDELSTLVLCLHSPWSEEKEKMTKNYHICAKCVS
jgi:hypothetical protein